MLKVLLLLALIFCSITALGVELHQKKVQCLDAHKNLVAEATCFGTYSCMTTGGQLLTNNTPQCVEVVTVGWCELKFEIWSFDYLYYNTTLEIIQNNTMRDIYT